MARKGELDGLWSRVRAVLEEVLEAEVTAFNAEVARLGLEGIVIR
jgi:hypothetical protein